MTIRSRRERTELGLRLRQLSSTWHRRHFPRGARTLPPLKQARATRGEVIFGNATIIEPPGGCSGFTKAHGPYEARFDDSGLMSLRSNWAAAAALLAACGSVHPATTLDGQPAPAPHKFTYRPGVTSYLSNSHRLVERGTGSRALGDSIVLRYRFTTVVTEADAALSVSFVIDTVLSATARNILQHEIDQVTGAVYAARISPTGQLEGFELADHASPLLRELATRSSDFFPALPADGLLPTLTWVDTAEVQRDQGGAWLTIRSVTTYRSGEWNATDGGVVLPVDWERTYHVDGTGNQFGQRFTLRGEGTASGRSLFASDGRYLGYVSQDDLIAELLLETLGTATPMRQRQIDTLRILR